MDGVSLCNDDDCCSDSSGAVLGGGGAEGVGASVVGGE